MIESLEPRTLMSRSLFRQELTLTSGQTSNVIAGDFDGNGTIDLATSGAVAMLNDGRGNFTRVPGWFGRASRDTTNDPLTAAADFNGDGMDDVAGSFGGRFSVFFARGRGRFHLPVTLPYASGAISTFDANGDHHPDIALTGTNSLQILLNDGHGN